MKDSVSMAVIGGTGFYEIEGMRDVVEAVMQTPFGPPSDVIRVGTLGSTRVAFLARHGAGHRLLPSEIPQRANIWALASLGVEHVVSVSAVGSLREEIEPRHMVLPDQFIDRTSGQRASTFFGAGVVAHVSLADPFCSGLNRSLLEAAKRASVTVHQGGTMVVIEGPGFSTRAESLRYRAWGASVIGMTASPEAKLAREAGMCYANLACVTDYDTWHAEQSSVSVDMIMENLQATVEMAKIVVHYVAQDSIHWHQCSSCAAQPQAIVTKRDAISEDRMRELGPILERYYPRRERGGDAELRATNNVDG
jgi:5'-methylthioadenosine phosphorylase